MDEQKIYAILRHYGPEVQTVKAIEEMSELQVELAKMANLHGDVEAIKSEIADVYIMLLQLMSIYDVEPEELDAEVAYKLDRQIRRIEEEKRAGVDCGWREGGM